MLIRPSNVLNTKMGKKKNSESSLGRSLIKDRFGGNKGRKFVADNSMVSNILFKKKPVLREKEKYDF